MIVADTLEAAIVLLCMAIPLLLLVVSIRLAGGRDA